MYIIAIAWIYVALMMALTEATHPQGSVMGAIFTFLLYGVGPLALVMYLMGTPMRREARKKQEAQEYQQHQQDQSGHAAPPSVVQPDQGRHAPGAAAAAEREIP